MVAQEISLVLASIEEESVFRVIEQARGLLGSDVEIIVVDKSSDAYEERLRKAGVRVIRQHGSGVVNALIEGFNSASGSILASTDADGTHDPSGLREGVELVRSGNADMVLGNRLGNLTKGSMPMQIRMGNAALSWLFRILYHTRTRDALTGLFVMRRDAFDLIKDIEPYRGGTEFFAMELAKRGKRLEDVQIRYYGRAHGKSKITKYKFGYGIKLALEMFRRRP